jgi:hypothetical protein
MMISSAPILAANDLLTLAEKVRAFVNVAKVKAINGITLAEFGELLMALMKIAIDAADSIPVDGAERKEFVINAVGLLFDGLADKAIPSLAWPVWIILKPAARQLLLLIAGGAIESLLPLVRKAHA